MLNLDQILNTFMKNIEKVLNIPKNFIEIITNPISLITIIGCIVIFLVFFKAKKIKLDAKIIANIGLALALATILNALKIYKFPQGGSINLGGMVPILLISFIYGPSVGMLTGLLFGLIDLTINPYILHPIQVLFDYPLPYLCLGIAGFFKEKKLLGAAIAIFFKFICHFISGVVFFGSFAPKGMSPIIYSLAINGSIVGIDGIICLVILYFLPIKRLLKNINLR